MFELYKVIATWNRKTENVSGMFNFFFFVTEKPWKVGFCHSFASFLNVFQMDVVYKVYGNLIHTCGEDSNWASHPPFVCWALLFLFFFFCITLISKKLFTINDSQSWQWGIYTYKLWQIVTHRVIRVYKLHHKQKVVMLDWSN